MGTTKTISFNFGPKFLSFKKVKLKFFCVYQIENFLNFSKMGQLFTLAQLSGPQCTVGVQMVLKLEEATFSYIASLLRFNGTLLRYYGAETYSVIKSLIINKDFCPGRL